MAPWNSLRDPRPSGATQKLLLPFFLSPWVQTLGFARLATFLGGAVSEQGSCLDHGWGREEAGVGEGQIDRLLALRPLSHGDVEGG